MSVLVGDVAGHLGAATAEALLRHGRRVVGLVEPAPGADPALRRARLGHLSLLQGFGFAADELAATGLPSDLAGVVQLIDTAPAPAPAALAARLARQLDLLELCARLRPLPHLVQVVIRPSHGQRVAEEYLARAHARLHGLPVTSLWLAEVYGPAGEPTQLCQRLAEAIHAGRPVLIPDQAPALRPLWLEDAVAAILAALARPPAAAPPFRRLELAGAEAIAPDELALRLATALGQAPPAGVRAIEAVLPDGDGDGPGFGAWSELGWQPEVGLAEGLARFAAWFRAHL